jgi:hypothetical protein
MRNLSRLGRRLGGFLTRQIIDGIPTISIDIHLGCRNSQVQQGRDDLIPWPPISLSL